MNIAVSERIKTFDIAKFIAIFLVLYGHTIQYLTSRVCYEDTVYQIIYAFHMPLFMVITGYFSNYAYRNGVVTFLKKKTDQLIVPGIFTGVVTCILMKYKSGGVIFETFAYGLWFLKAAFLCFIVYSVIAYCKSLKIKVWLIIFTLAVSQLIYYSQFNLMYPCFLFGILLNHSWSKIRTNRNLISLVSGSIFISMLIPWDESFWKISDNAIYPLHSLEQHLSFLFPFYYRMAIGLVGAIFIIIICDIVCDKLSNSKIINNLANIGKDTLAIYLIQTLILEILIWRFVRFDNTNIPLFQFVIAPIMSLAVLVICLVIIKVVRHMPFAARLILGDPKR